jgi:Ricin-type beta-trefoil lectin domain
MSDLSRSYRRIVASDAIGQNMDCPLKGERFNHCWLKLKELKCVAGLRLIANLGEHSKARMAVEQEGGLSMRNFRTAAATLAATGIAALGAMAATGGVANAATNLSITGCSTNVGVLTAGLFVNCSAPTGTIYNPTQITTTVNKTALTALLGDLGVGVKVKYNLSCSVDGSWVNSPQGFTATKSNQNVQVVNLMQAVGSPEPNQCQVQNLSVESLASLSVLRYPILGFGATVTGNNGVPGAIWAQYPPSTSGAGSTVCADDTGNRNAGTKIQAYQCEQDLADQWIQVSKQLVHNGDCMTNDGGWVKLEKCEGGRWSAPSQTWNVTGTPYKAGWITMGKNWCLSAPASGMVDGAQLSVQKCGATGYVQAWKAPGPTAV